MVSKRRVNEAQAESRQRKRLKKETKRRSKESDEQQTQEETDQIKTTKHAPNVVSPLLHKQRLSMIISLLPVSLGSVKENLEDAMKGFLLKFSAGFGGILLAFQDLEVINGGKGRIIGELPYIHYEVECSALIFKPQTGVEMNGMIVESFDSHVSMIVHQYFNASITAQHLRDSGFKYDTSGCRWVHAEDDNKTLSTNTLVRFTIERVHESGALPLTSRLLNTHSEEYFAHNRIHFWQLELYRLTVQTLGLSQPDKQSSILDVNGDRYSPWL